MQKNKTQKQFKKILLLPLFIAVFGLGFFAFSSQAWATTYYAAPSPTGSGITCSSDSPCTLHYAVNTKAVGGDTVFLKDGNYTALNSGTTYGRGRGNAVLRIQNDSGSEGNWITIKAENKWGAVLRGDENVTDIHKGSQFTSIGIQCGFTSSGTSENDYIRIEDMEFTMFANGGSAVFCGDKWSNYGMGTYSPTCEGGNTYCDILSRGRNWYLKGNKIHDIGQVNGTPNEAISYGGGGIYIGSEQDNWTVDGNIFYNIGTLNGYTDPVYHGTPSDLCNNQIWWHVSNAYPCDAHEHVMYVWGDNLLIKNNIFSNYKSGWAIKPSPYRHRDIYSNIGLGTKTYISNNTFTDANPRMGGVLLPWLWYSSQYILAQNNIFYTTDGIWRCLSGSNGTIEMKNNLVKTGGVLYSVKDSDCTSLTKIGASSTIYGEPNFTNSSATLDFSLQPTSPAINAGLSTNAPLYDILGTLRSSFGLPDIGAYEYTGSVASPADVDGSESVNIKDIQACIKVITGTDTRYQNQCKVLAAPIDRTNIKDIQKIIQAIIGN